MHTRRQILKCLAALPVVGPIASLSSSTAGAAPKALSIAFPPGGISAAAAAPSLMPVIPAGEVILGTYVYDLDHKNCWVYWHPFGVPQEQIDKALAAKAAGQDVNFDVGKKIEVQSCPFTDFLSDMPMPPFAIHADDGTLHDVRAVDWFS
jgi:hypothetical protein